MCHLEKKRMSVTILLGINKVHNWKRSINCKLRDSRCDLFMFGSEKELREGLFFYLLFIFGVPTHI